MTKSSKRIKVTKKLSPQVSIETLALEALSYLEYRYVDSEPIVAIRIEAPDWVNDLLEAIQKDNKSEYYRESFLMDALTAIRDSNSRDVLCPSSSIHGLTKWFASEIHRIEYLDLALGRFTKETAVALLMSAQLIEMQEVFDLTVNFLTQQLKRK